MKYDESFVIFKDAGLNLDEVYQCDDPKQVENGGLTPYDSEQNMQKSNPERPLILELGNNDCQDEEAEDEKDSLLPPSFTAKRRRSSLIPLTTDNPQDIVRRHRRMSTMSTKLDKWILPAIDTNSSKSLNNSRMGGGSNTSLNNVGTKERKNSTTIERKNSILREHDIM